MTEEQKTLTVAPTAGNAVKAFIPSSVEEMRWTIQTIQAAGLAPDSYKNDGNKIAVAIMKGLEVGLPPLNALANIAIINGRPSLYGDGVMALIQNSGQLDGMKVEDLGDVPTGGLDEWPDEFGVKVTMRRHGQDEPYIGEFTVAMAKRAGLWMKPNKKPWMEHPRRMLYWRAFSIAARNGFADVLAGLSVAEEAEDIPHEAPKADTSFLDDEPKDITEEVVNLDEVATLATDPAEAKVAELIANFEAADTLEQINAIAAEVEIHAPAMTDDQFSRVGAAHKTAMKETEQAPPPSP